MGTSFRQAVTVLFRLIFWGIDSPAKQTSFFAIPLVERLWQQVEKLSKKVSLLQKDIDKLTVNDIVKQFFKYLIEKDPAGMKPDPSEMFKILGVETRVKIIELLKYRGPLGAKKIAELVGITAAAVSQHLKVLKQAGLVRNERKGYWIPYSIDEEALEGCRTLLNEVCTCGCEGTGKFKEQQLDEASLAGLMNYAKELEKELTAVRVKISELDGQG